MHCLLHLFPFFLLFSFCLACSRDWGSVVLLVSPLSSVLSFSRLWFSCFLVVDYGKGEGWCGLTTSRHTSGESWHLSGLCTNLSRDFFLQKFCFVPHSLCLCLSVSLSHFFLGCTTVIVLSSVLFSAGFRWWVGALGHYWVASFPTVWSRKGATLPGSGSSFSVR